MLTKIKTIFVRSCKEFFASNCLDRASSLAYTTLLSCVPFLVISFSLLTLLPWFASWKTKIQDMVIANLVTSSAQSLQIYLHKFIAQAGNLPTISSIFLLVTAVLLIFNLEKTFNQIWHIKQNRKGWLAFFIYTLAILLIPLVIAMFLFSVNYLLYLPWIAKYSSILPIKTLLYFVSHGIFLSIMTLLYVSLPNRRVPVKSAILSALLTTILFDIAKKGFIIYVTYAREYKIIYGALASFPMFLIWLYIAWIIILFGVVVNYVLVTDNKRV